jgi:hypothetical protein
LTIDGAGHFSDPLCQRSHGVLVEFSIAPKYCNEPDAKVASITSDLAAELWHASDKLSKSGASKVLGRQLQELER